MHGGGSPVIPSPGLGAGTRLFFKVVPLLAARHRVVVVDPRGGGRSDKPMGDYSVEQMSDDLAGLLGVLGWPAPMSWPTRWGQAISSLLSEA